MKAFLSFIQKPCLKCPLLPPAKSWEGRSFPLENLPFHLDAPGKTHSLCDGLAQPERPAVDSLVPRGFGDFQSEPNAWYEIPLNAP